ncbi:serine/threonine protein kinase [Capillimicrobium parvum]|uniref:serine/threonine protein kinase n=1 Tax=Capillimicrobium parvum TaxID=2884022 RepID=UPI00216ABEC8|nr:hypothetical protein [Capillimicrobium parvum]
MPSSRLAVAPFEIERALDHQPGVFAAYAARDPRRDDEVLLRVLVHLARRPAGLGAFSDAVALRRRLRHPGLAEVIDAGRSPHGPWIATRPAPGRTLDDLLAAERRLSAERTIAILAAIAAALDAAHAVDLVCDSLTAHAILVGGDAGREDAGVLADVGPRWPGSLRPGRLLGDVDGLAPEEIRGEAPSPRSNVYSLAALLVRCLTGDPPYTSGSRAGTLGAHLSASPPSVCERVAGSPPALDQLVASALAKDPAARPSTAGELVARAADALCVDAPLVPACGPVSDPPAASPIRGAAAGEVASRGENVPPPRRSRARGTVRALAVGIPAVLLIGLALVAALRSAGGAEQGTPATPGRTAQQLGPRVASATLLPPGGQAGATAPSGTTRVEALRGRRVITIAAEGLAPEPRTPVAAYAVWLVRSSSDALPLGFVVPPVGTSGRFVNHRDLPAGAERYREVVVTLEHAVHDTPEGPVVLRGPLRLPDLTATGPQGRGPRPAGRSGRGG